MLRQSTSRRKKNLFTFENPYPYGSGDKTTWDYFGPYEVVRRNYHIKDGKRQWIVSVVLWDGTYKKGDR